MSKIEDIYTELDGKINEPLRHSYYTVLIISKPKER